jgi:hypothetical protein
MKQPYPKPLTFRLIAVLLVITAALVTHSCKKDRPEVKPPLITITNPMVSQAKQWYDSVYTSVSNTKQTTQSTGKAKHDLSKKFLPNWAKANTFTKDGITYIEIPAIKNGDMAISFTKPKDTVNFDFSRSGSLTDLVIVKGQNNFNMYVMTILADTSYLKGDYSKLAKNTYQKLDTNFTGAVFFNKMDGTFVNGWRYRDGVIIRSLSPYTGTSGQTIQSVSDNKLKVNFESPCGAIVGVTVYEDCYQFPSGESLCYISSDVSVMDDCPYAAGGSSGGPGGGISSPSPCSPPPANASINTGHLTVNVAMPPPGGGSTCAPATITIITIIDPCAQLSQVTTLAQNAAIAQANHQIYNDIGTGHEYGNEDNLSSWPSNGSYVSTPVRTDFNDTQFTANFTWNSTNGYTINISHEHPGGNAPSPTDVFQLINNSVNKDLKAAGASALDYYKKNASMTVITTDATYVVTIADYNALAALSTSQSLASFNLEYQEVAGNHLGSTEYALLSIFKGSINLYKASGNGTDFSPITINANGSIINTPCP